MRVPLRLQFARVLVTAMGVGAVTLALGGTALGLGGVLTTRDRAYPAPTLSGTVTDSNGTPIGTENVCVKASRYPYSGTVARVITNRQGQYEFAGLAPGDYYVHAYDCPSDKTRNDAVTYYTNSGSPAAVAVDAGQAVTGIDIQLAAATTITGVVYGGSVSTRVADVCVKAVPAVRGQGYPDHPATTGSDGSYTLTHVAPGVAYVLFFDPSCGSNSTYTSQYWDGAYSFATATSVTSTLANPATASPVLALGGTVSGTVSLPAGSSLSLHNDICVSAAVADDGLADSLWSGYAVSPATDGSYEITGLPSGHYYIYAWDCGDYSLATAYYGVDAQGYPKSVSVSEGVQTSAVDIAMSTGSSISGHVYGGNDNTTPLGGVCAYAEYVGGGLPNDSNYGYYGYSGTTTTATDGTYTISGLVSDATYTVEFDPCVGGTASEYRYQYYDGASDPGDAAEVLAPATGVDAHLVQVVQPSGTGTITGQVTDQAGPLVGTGVCVEAIPTATGQYASGITNSSGDYALANVVPGTYLLYAYSCGSGASYGEGYYGTGSSTETSVTVVNGGTLTANIALPGVTSITGTVYGGSGTNTPLNGVCVTAVPQTSPNGDQDSVESRTGPDGTYSLAGLDIGTSYDVSFDPRCVAYNTVYQEQWYTSSGGTDNASDATAVAATAAGVAGINGHLDTGGSISGSVDDANGAPITSGDICVAASSVNGYVYQSARTDSAGDYTIVGLPAGTYYVEFSDCSGSARDDLGEYYGNTPNAYNSQTVTLSEGGQQAGVNAQLAAGTSISGSVYGGAGDTTPLKNMCVQADGNNGGYGYAESSSTGTYTISHLPVDDYIVSFYDCSSTGYLEQFFDGSAGGTTNYGSATPVTPTASQPVTGVDAHMILGGSISGTITDASGNPVSDACVAVYDISGNNVNSGQTDYAGDYTVPGLANGSYTVEASDCYQGNYSNHDDLGESSSAVQVSEPNTTTGVDLTLQLATSISGRALTQTNSGRETLSDMCVTVENTDGSQVILANGNEASGYTDYNGGYTIDGLPAGSYIVLFSDCYGGGTQYQDAYYSSSYSGGATSIGSATTVSPTSADPSTGIDVVMGAAPVATITGGPEANAATNATTATISFVSSLAGSQFECSLDNASFVPCTSPYTTGTLGTGDHTFRVEATQNGVTQPSPTELYWTISSSATATSTSGTVPAGGTFSSDPGGSVSTSTPLIVSVTAPNIPALADGATVVEQTNPDVTTTSPNGYQLFGSQMQISVSAAGGGSDITAPLSSPIALTFQLAASQIPSGVTYQEVTVTRNGAAVPDCTATDGSATPDPCVSTRTETGSGSSAVLTLTVLTTECSTWNFAQIAAPTNQTAPPVPSGTAQVGQQLSAGPGTWSNASNGESYQWQRCSSTDTSTCTNIASANASTYTLTSADQGQYIRVVVTASNNSGSTQAESALTAQVAAATGGSGQGSSGGGSTTGGSTGSGPGSSSGGSSTGGTTGSGTGTSTGSSGGSSASAPPQITLVGVLGAGTTARVTIRCSGGGPAAACRGTLVMTTVERVKVGKHKTKPKTITLGRAVVELAGGGVKAIRISLNGTGRSLLTRLGRLAVSVKLTPATGTSGSASTLRLTLHRPTKKKK